MKNDTIVVGVDVGGSHITAGLVNLQQRKLLKESEVRLQVNSNGSAEEISSLWVEAIQQSIHSAKEKIEFIGIAMPGPFDYASGISYMEPGHKYGSLYNLNIGEILSSRLHIASGNIRFRNDAEAFLEGEVFSGAGRNYHSVFGLTLGSGLGSARYHFGICEDAQMWNAPFKDSMVEDYISTRWFVSRYHALTGESIKDVKQLIEKLNTQPAAKIVLDEFIVNLAELINEIISKENPEVIVLGGNIANAYPLFKAPLEKLLPADCKCLIKPFELGEHAALIGAACLWEKDITVTV